MASDTLELLLPPVTAIGGVVLGWWLGGRTARRAAAEQREWQERQTVREREELASAQLNEALIEIGKFTPQVQMKPEEALEPLSRAIGQLHEARVRTAVIVEPEITSRLAALDSALFIAGQDARDVRKPTIDFWPLSVAFKDVHNALVAFRRREEVPERRFPSAHELSALAFPEGRIEGMDGVMRHLLERERERLESQE